MDLQKATSPKLIFVDIMEKSKDGVLEFLTEQLFVAGKITSKERFLADVYAREKLSPTGFENGLAIPHGKSDAVKEASFAIARLQNPITEYESIDPNNQVTLVFLLAIPSNEAGSTHLKLLSELVTKLSNPDYLKLFMKAKDSEEIYKLLARQEKNEEPTSIESNELILGVTACPAGIAHTYMAAEALERAGRELGVKVLVEKQGANGIEDRHTTRQISQAKAVIFANDVAVKNSERYAKLPHVNTTVAAPLRNAKELIQEALDKSKNFQPDNESVHLDFEENDGEKSFGMEVKDSVLTGISYIIPIIIAGGMITTFAVLITQIFGLQEVMAEETSWLFLLKSLGGGLLGQIMIPVLAAFMSYSIADKPGLAPGFTGGLAAMTINSGFLGGMLAGLAAGFLMKFMKKHIKAKGALAGFVSFWVYPVVGSLLIGILMLFIIGKPVAFINNGLINWLDTLQGSNALLLGAVLGAMVSFDLGGPVNKAAYAFCIGAMSNGNFIPYAAFASVKMVSAFSVSAACIIRKDLFTKQEKEIGDQTWLLGLAGITEGAIPFMMNDPVRVIASFVAGSAVTGAIVAYFQIGLTVPGAGIFSMGLLDSTMNGLTAALIWFFAAILGAAISTCLLIITRSQKLKKQAL